MISMALSRGAQHSRERRCLLSNVIRAFIRGHHHEDWEIKLEATTTEIPCKAQNFERGKAFGIWQIKY